MKFYPGCKFLCVFQVLCESLTYYFTSGLVCTYFPSPAPLTFLFSQTYILQIKNIQILVDVQFKVRLYHISFIFFIYVFSIKQAPSLSCLIGLLNSTFLLFILIVLTAIWIALLVCLEHSFWITKKGSNPSDAFAEAWSFYFETQSALVNQELHDYLKSNSHKDWFTTYHHPSVEEWAKCKEIIFNNLLCKSHPFFFFLSSSGNC